MKITESYKKKTQDLSNLTKEEQEGLKTLKKKVADNTVLCYQTVKSGRWSCDTKENYRKACQKHLSDPSKTEVINLQTHEDAEKEMNAHGQALLRMLGLKNDHQTTLLRRFTFSGKTTRKSKKDMKRKAPRQDRSVAPLSHETYCISSIGNNTTRRNPM